MTATHPRVRTFHGRRRRTTPRMQQVLDDAGARRGFDARVDPTRPLVLEVGCGYGEAAVAFARAHPDVDVLATDVHTPGIVSSLELAMAEGVDNLYVERADALDVLDDRVEAGTVSGVHLFFPDPWPKTRHRKRRFVRPDVLDLLADRMRPDATLLVATDVEAYADQVLAEVDRHPAFHGGRAARPAWRPETRYEAAARRAGRRVADLRFHRG